MSDAPQYTQSSNLAGMMLIGYARVSTPGQNLDRQIATLESAGCQRIFAEKKSGKELTSRPELAAAIDGLKAGDILVLAEWDRATRSMYDGIAIMTRVSERGALLKALDRSWLDLTTPIGQGILAFLSSLAQDERERILRRAEEGRQEARKRGKRFGRPLSLTLDQIENVRARLANGESCRSIARSHGVTHNVISRIRDRGAGSTPHANAKATSGSIS